MLPTVAVEEWLKAKVRQRENDSWEESLGQSGTVGYQIYVLKCKMAAKMERSIPAKVSHTQCYEGCHLACQPRNDVEVRQEKESNVEYGGST